MSVIYKGLRTRVLFKDFIRVPRHVSLIIDVSNKVQFESLRNRVSLGRTNKCLPPGVWFGCKTYQMENYFETSIVLKDFHNFFSESSKAKHLAVIIPRFRSPFWIGALQNHSKRTVCFVFLSPKKWEAHARGEFIFLYKHPTNLIWWGMRGGGGKDPYNVRK